VVGHQSLDLLAGVLGGVTVRIGAGAPSDTITAVLRALKAGA
jgi:hypothetical protein